MQRRFIIPVLITAAVVTGACSDEPTRPASAPQEGAGAPLLNAAPHAEVVRDRYIVVFRDDVGNAAELGTRLVAAHGGKLHYTYQHALKGFAATLPAQAVEGLRHNPNVQYIEPDQVARASATQLSPPWGLDRVDQRDLPLDNGYTYVRTGLGVRAYVIDSGIQTSHPEFGGRATVGYDAIGDGQNGQDCFGHGTHVAGIIGASTYGIAKNVQLVAVRVLRCDGWDVGSSIIAGVDWVTGNRIIPAVANMSLRIAASPALDQAVRNSILSGVTYVVGAGNENDNACNYSPARVGEALTVGATDSSDRRSYFSNWGSCVDLFAPGTSIRSTWLLSGTRTSSGTSQASPHVAGFAARYLEPYYASSPASVHSAVLYWTTKDKVIDPAGSPNRLLYTYFEGGSTGRPPGCCR